MRAQEFDDPKEKFVDMFRKFLPLAMEIIGLKSLPKIVFEKEVDSPDQPTFGQYVNNEHILYVGLANRHPNDILRTIAHELVHYKQDTDHKLNNKSGDTGSPEENEANAVAGIVMRNFNKRYPEYLKVKPVIAETWSEKYKSSINCNNPKGFSQRAHCQGRKKDEDIDLEERKRKKIKRAAYGPGPYGWYGYYPGYSGETDLGGGDGGAAESAGDRGDIPTGKGEQLIPFPQGTSMVDVSDVYDWYKLGMVISDLDDADPNIFGKGAPHTVIAFGSEEEEHKMLPLLKRLGLKIHDIDRPEDVKKVIPAKMFVKDVAETIRKVGSQYRLVSKSGKNLGTYPSKAGAEKRERQVQYFKHVNEEIVVESKSAPLYHFTTWNNLISIIHSNQLVAPSGKIYLTRDYNRQFIPHADKLFKQPYGLRLNQELLSRDYGRKLQAGGQDIGWDEEKRQAWLSDPKNAREIEMVKQTGRGSGSRYDGADPVDIVRGTIRQSRRWESEEHLNVKNLPNLDKYITGIVIGKAPIGKAPIGSAHRTKELDPDPLTKLADTIIHLFSGPKGFDQRNWFLDSTAKLGVPIIYDRKEYDSAEVKKRIIQLYSQRKKEREEEQSKPQKDFIVITSPAGGGIVTGGSDINAVFNKLVKDPRHTNREIYGYSIGLGPDAEKKMFDQPIPLLQLVKNPQTQGITENFDKEANEYEAYLNRTKDSIMRFLAGVRGAPSEDDMLKAIAVAVDVMKRTGDIKQAAKAKQDYLLNISQNKQGVAEKRERQVQYFKHVSEGIAPPLPDVLYHGGPKSVTQFNIPPYGVYFSPHQNHAQGYGNVVTAAKVNADKVYLIDYSEDIDEDIMDALFDMDYNKVAEYVKMLKAQGYQAMQSISDSEMVVVFPGTDIQVIDEQGVIENLINEAQTFDFDGEKQAIIQFINNVLNNKPNNRQYNPFYGVIVGNPKIGSASKLGLPDTFAVSWKKYFQNPSFVGGAPEPWSQVNIGDQFAKATGDDRTLNFYITVDKEKNNIIKFFNNLHKLGSYLQPISQQYQTPLKFKTHSLLDSFVGHNDSLKVYYYDPQVKDLVVNATRKWLSDSGVVTGTRSHEHGVDVKSGGGSFGQILSNHIYDTFTKLIQTQGNKYTPEQYFEWLKQHLPSLIQQVKQKEVAENFADGRNPQDRGDSARHGIRKGMTIAQLKKIRSSDSASPRKKQLAHWQINMRQGRKK